MLAAGWLIQHLAPWGRTTSPRLLGDHIAIDVHLLAVSACVHGSIDLRPKQPTMQTHASGVLLCGLATRCAAVLSAASSYSLAGVANMATALKHWMLATAGLATMGQKQYMNSLVRFCTCMAATHMLFGCSLCHLERQVVLCRRLGSVHGPCHAAVPGSASRLANISLPKTSQPS